MITLDQAGAAAPHLRTRRPPPALRPLVELSWVQGRTPAPRGASWRIVPDPQPHIIHHRSLDGSSSTVLVGARSVYVDVEQATRRYTVGVRLTAGALPVLLRDGAWLLRDGQVDLGDALGATSRAGIRRAEDETDPLAVERALLGLLGRYAEGGALDWRAAGFAQLLRDGATRPGRRRGDTVSGHARALGVSDRSLRDVCRRTIGLRPKEAQRVVRLHRALELVLSGTPDARAAHAVGYSDQAHLIRESRSLLGDTPAAFRARADSFKTVPESAR